MRAIDTSATSTGVTTTLYRMYDASGTLLYVGISNRPLDRKGQHKSHQPWWTEIVSMTLEHYPTRQEALTAETRAIVGECPRYNKAGTPTYEREARVSRMRPPREMPPVVRHLSHPVPATRHTPTGRLMGLREIETRMEVSRQRVHQLTEHKTFPAAYDVIKAGRIWLAEDVEAWIAEHRPPSAS
jgi:predicted DNA-binding transcriptional regulator AlpA/predicted GIY-YIG superfamily endonuclease